MGLFDRLFGGGSQPVQQKTSTSRLSEALSKKYEQSPQLSYMWRVELPVLAHVNDSTGGVVVNYINRYVKSQNKDFGSTIMGVKGTEAISHRVYEITAPFTSYDTEKRPYAGSFTFAASHSEIGSISIVVDEYEDGQTLEYFESWMKMITNPDGTKNPPAVYKRNLKYMKMSSMQTDIHSSEYIGCFPTEISPLHNSYENNGVMQYSITLACDDVVHKKTTSSDKASLERELIGKKYSSK